MQKNITRVFSTLLCLVLLVGMIPATARAEEVTSGMLDTRISWRFDPNSGILYIQGDGAMPDYDGADDAPWYTFKNQIVAVEIGDGISSVSPYAFHDYTGLTSVRLPNTLGHIGAYAFAGCSSLPYVDLPDWLSSMGQAAFADCSVLLDVVIPTSLGQIPADAFANCTSLVEITLPWSVWYVGEYAFGGCTGIREVIFTGHGPTIAANAFEGVTATAYYTGSYDWDDSLLQNYGGSLTWHGHASIAGSWYTDITLSAADLGVNAPDACLRAHVTFGDNYTCTVNWEVIDLTAIRMYFHQMFVASYYACAYGAGMTDLNEIEALCVETTGKSVSDYMSALLDQFDMNALFTPPASTGTYQYDGTHTAIYTNMPFMAVESNGTVADTFTVDGNTLLLNAASWGKPEYTFHLTLEGTPLFSVTNVTYSSVNIRSYPSATAPLTGSLYYGQTATIYETRVSEGHTWGRTGNGWIFLDYVQVNP